MNIESAAHVFWTEWQMRQGLDENDGVEEAFHEWCEGQQIPAEHRNAIWREVAAALGIDPPGAR